MLAHVVAEQSRRRVDASAATTIVGAFFGGAILLLGNWVNRLNERARAALEAAERLARLRTLITAELVNVAAGLIAANQLVNAAKVQLESTGGIVGLDLSAELPRDMPYTFGVGAELLLLPTEAIDALTTLRANLVITTGQMSRISSATGGAGLLGVTALANGLRFTTRIAGECFERIAPERKLSLSGKEAPAFKMLYRLADGENL